MSWLKRFQEKYNITSMQQVIIILIVFACTGFSALYCRKFVFALVGIPEDLTWYWHLLATIFIILPVYQVLLLAWGWIFGQFKFFWEFEKQTLGKLFKRRK